MTVCTDVYVRPQTCDEIWIYPSQVHPGGDCHGCGPEEPPQRRRQREPLHPFDVLLTDDDVEVALALLALL